MHEELNPETSTTRHRKAVLEKRMITKNPAPHAAASSMPQGAHATLSFGPAVGDPNSDAKGSGARWNEGKVPYDMLPINLLSDWMGKQDEKYGGGMLGNGTASEIIAHIGSYQAGSDIGLDMALAAAADEGVGLEKFAGAAQVFQHVTTRAVKPYPKWNWMKGMAWSVPIGCILRHAQKIQAGEDTDPETGFPHMAHIQCNLIMLLLYRETYKEGDDRPPKNFLPA
jgi:hypothetical protein